MWPILTQNDSNYLPASTQISNYFLAASAAKIFGKEAVIKAANYVLDMERADPILNTIERQQEPMFRMPKKKGKQLPTNIFDGVISIVGFVQQQIEASIDLSAMRSFKVGSTTANVARCALARCFAPSQSIACHAEKSSICWVKASSV